MTSSPPAPATGSDTTNVATMPSTFSVSRCGAKNPPGSYTSSLYRCANVCSGGQPSPVAARWTISPNVSSQAPPMMLTRSASTCKHARTVVSTSVSSPLP